jgi:Ni2+-binding GTPase involved in maturation of urease and hydrogenase
MARSEALRHNPKIEIMQISTVSGEGIDEWTAFLERVLGNR